MSDLIRIVRMTFREEEVDKFLAVFHESKKKIRGFEGCLHLELHQDYNEGNIFSTYSIWKNQKALDEYRNSALFKSVWSRTKPLFKDKPIAFSNKSILKV
ncbi:MAG: antibiotic biosynthesis monooxygenase [Bacteroidota bacterium]